MVSVFIKFINALHNIANTCFAIAKILRPGNYILHTLLSLHRTIPTLPSLLLIT